VKLKDLNGAAAVATSTGSVNIVLRVKVAPCELSPLCRGGTVLEVGSSLVAETGRVRSKQGSKSSTTFITKTQLRDRTKCKTLIQNATLNYCLEMQCSRVIANPQVKWQPRCDLIGPFRRRSHFTFSTPSRDLQFRRKCSPTPDRSLSTSIDLSNSQKEYSARTLTFQEAVSRLQQYWSSVGCAVFLPHNTEVGAGTMNPATFLRVLGPEPWNVCYVEPSIRPDDSRFGENPNRVQRHTQFQVILKPDPGNPQELYLQSLEALGINCDSHDVRFVEDNWESPVLGAWGLGWEVSSRSKL